MEMLIDFPGGARVDAHFGPYAVRTDQPPRGGGEGSAPTPFTTFLASIGTCAGIYVQGFCAKRNIPIEGIRLVERPSFDDKGTLVKVEMRIELPPSFPEKYRDAVIRTVEQCSVKPSIQAQPVFDVATTIRT